MDLPDGVHRLALDVSLGDRAATLNLAAIETDAGLILLDTGLESSVDELAATLDDAGFSLDDVALVLLTHQDMDHAGGLASVLDRTDAVSVAHERDAPVIDGRESPVKSGGGERYPPARVDLELGDEAAFNTHAGPARVLPTPGHTPGHVSVYLPDERFLISGDALTADEDGLQGPRPDVTPDMDRALDAAGDLAALDIEGVLCYHGGPVEADGDRIAEIVADAE